jgi:hypothetical protein
MRKVAAMRTLPLWITVAALMPLPAQGLPVASSPQRLGSVVVWADSEDPGLFYYLPGELRIARRADGGSDAAFLAVRYLGTTLGGDSERSFVRSCLTAQVEMVPQDQDALAQAASELRRERGRAVRVLPVPVQRIKTALVFASADTGSARPTTFSGGFLEPAGTEARDSFWQRRSFTIYLGPVDAQLVLTAVRAGSALLSLSFEITTRAIDLPATPATPPATSPSGTPAAAASEHTVAATALPLVLDVAHFPDRLALLEIEASSPPGYPLLSVYCYDFAEQVDPALSEKTLELEGEGLQGERVLTSLSFSSDAPDVSARSVRFPFPVRLDRPFRQRVSETYWSGEERVAPWSRAQDWTSVLDITARH